MKKRTSIQIACIVVIVMGTFSGCAALGASSGGSKKPEQAETPVVHVVTAEDDGGEVVICE